jgi:hypothetical protein
MGDVTAELLKSIGMNVDFVATDWGTVGARRAQKTPPDQGGWSMFHTWHAGADCVNPASYTAIRANGDKAWFGWPDVPAVETEVTNWFNAKNPRRRRRRWAGSTRPRSRTSSMRRPASTWLSGLAEERHGRHQRPAALLERREGLRPGGAARPFRTPRAGRLRGLRLPRPGVNRAAASGSAVNEAVGFMLAFVVRRIVTTIPVMAFVALFVFSLLYIAPGDPAAIIAGDQASPADVERIRASLGLDRPYLVRFAEWSFRVLQGDLGTSIFTNLPVTQLIAQRIEPTLADGADADLRRRGRRADGRRRRLEGRHLDRQERDGLRRLGFSVPVFVVGYLLAYVFALKLDWLPVQGYTPISQGFWPWLQNLILPAVALGWSISR